ncbi:ABC transporter substrate-binding protein [Paracoccus aminophilus]|uniref:ABC-type branched-chain amino acid transport systems, periplasmic component n=1 Tax=Paracoccus aminophilus JCM 7686 TaxID=1367847 RepID=S5YIY9_PARAH|nr:ABC transporter substrate-binding protein [Paracoccus aminophilus]AGT11433.1 ABC-type branched-chain amino acid transport systems, periplasmic component [Paracoccus aminophilus JCM 7686]
MQISLAQRLAVAGTLPRNLHRATAPVRIGLIAPLSGRSAPWGKPGLEGCQIWADWVNEQGGLIVGPRRQRVELLARDAALGPEETRMAAIELVERCGARILLTLGGDTLSLALPWLMAHRVLTTTLLPFDLSPDTPTLIAPTEIHPLLVVTGVEWLAENRPDLRRVALCSQEDMLGLPSLATYRAAFAAEGMSITRELRYPATGADATEMVAAMLADDPDILCWCSSEPYMVHALTEAAFEAGFRGPILCCTGDQYQRMVARTSVDFMENFIFQFPDFDDPALAGRAFYFCQPAAFHAAYQQRFPGHWSAVSWEYAGALDLWQQAVEIAGTTDPRRVLEAMKRGGQMMHAFGPARWSGETLFGIDNALIGNWPVVRVTGGVARIAGFRSILDWLGRHEARLSREMEALGLLWPQRAARMAGAAINPLA